VVNTASFPLFHAPYCFPLARLLAPAVYSPTAIEATLEANAQSREAADSCESEAAFLEKRKAEWWK
jgi:hypothetical protein